MAEVNVKKLWRVRKASELWRKENRIRIPKRWPLVSNPSTAHRLLIGSQSERILNTQIKRNNNCCVRLTTIAEVTRISDRSAGTLSDVLSVIPIRICGLDSNALEIRSIDRFNWFLTRSIQLIDGSNRLVLFVFECDCCRTRQTTD